MTHNFDANYVDISQDRALAQVVGRDQIAVVDESVIPAQVLIEAVAQATLAASWAETMREIGPAYPYFAPVENYALQALDIASARAHAVEQSAVETAPVLPEGFNFEEGIYSLKILKSARVRSLPTSKPKTFINTIPEAFGSLKAYKVLSADNPADLELGFDWYYAILPNGEGVYIAAISGVVEVTLTDRSISPAETPAAAIPIGTEQPATPIGTEVPPTVDPNATEAPATQSPDTIPTGPAVAPTSAPEAAGTEPAGGVDGETEAPESVAFRTPEPLKTHGSGWTYNDDLLAWTSEFTNPEGEVLTRVCRPFAGLTVDQDDIACEQITLQENISGPTIEFFFEWNTLSADCPFQRVTIGDVDPQPVGVMLEDIVREAAPFLSNLKVDKIYLTTICSDLPRNIAQRSDINDFRFPLENNSVYIPTYIRNPDGTTTLQITLHLDKTYFTGEWAPHVIFTAISSMILTLSFEDSFYNQGSNNASEEIFLKAMSFNQDVPTEIYMLAANGSGENPFITVPKLK